jgi:hypothetical protein
MKPLFLADGPGEGLQETKVLDLCFHGGTYVGSLKRRLFKVEERVFVDLSTNTIAHWWGLRGQNLRQ